MGWGWEDCLVQKGRRNLDLEVAVQASPPGAELEGVPEREERVSPQFRTGSPNRDPEQELRVWPKVSTGHSRDPFHAQNTGLV